MFEDRKMQSSIVTDTLPGRGKWAGQARRVMERRDFLGGAARLALAAATSRWATPARASDPQRITVAAVGDCLITRGFTRNDPGFQPLLSLLRGADVAFGNFELTLPGPDMYPAATGACGDLNNSAEGPMA